MKVPVVTHCVLFRWAVVKDENVFQRMTAYVSMNTMGVSRDTQLRTLQLIKVVLKDGGKEIFDFGYTTLRSRWEKLNETLSISKRFTLQEMGARYCNFFNKIRGPSPGSIFTILTYANFSFNMNKCKGHLRLAQIGCMSVLSV